MNLYQVIRTNIATAIINTINRMYGWLTFYKPTIHYNLRYHKFNSYFEKATPIRYRLNSSLGSLYKGSISIFLKIGYRTTRKFNIVETTLKSSFYNSSTLILHSAFECLVNFVEVEIPLDNDKRFLKYIRKPIRNAKYGIQFLIGRMRAETDIQVENDIREVLDLYYWWDNYRDTKVCDLAEEQRMLQRLVNIRSKLWF